MPKKAKLTEIYRRYGFEFAKFYEEEKVLVFTLKTGYFDNADIVPLSEEACTEKAFNDFSKTGYACTVRKFLDPIIIENELFKGFFSVSSILDRLKRDYLNFTSSIVKQYSDTASYKYINSKYYINGNFGERSPAEEVISRLNINKPILF